MKIIINKQNNGVSTPSKSPSGDLGVLLSFHTENVHEAGCDEAGRGCLSGPVYAAAVIFAPDYTNERLHDSKKLSDAQRKILRPIIEQDALAWAVGVVDNNEIDTINILQASFLAMHRALDALAIAPQHILVDGNRFKPYKTTPHHCIVKGDDKYLSIAAASILAKTYRDDYMEQIHNEFPHYDWQKNKGYPTIFHRKAIYEHGLTPYHRKTFNSSIQLELF